jgi:hypothetical protein
MDTPLPSDSGTRDESPTLEELRIKLAQYAIDAQRAELALHIRRLADAGTQDNAQAA